VVELLLMYMSDVHYNVCFRLDEELCTSCCVYRMAFQVVNSRIAMEMPNVRNLLSLEAFCVEQEEGLQIHQRGF
jgi:hypothetical protein